jgi:hypothetical protein
LKYCPTLAPKSICSVGIHWLKKRQFFESANESQVARRLFRAISKVKEIEQRTGVKTKDIPRALFVVAATK